MLQTRAPNIPSHIDNNNNNNNDNDSYINSNNTKTTPPPPPPPPPPLTTTTPTTNIGRWLLSRRFRPPHPHRSTAASAKASESTGTRRLGFLLHPLSGIGEPSVFARSRSRGPPQPPRIMPRIRACGGNPRSCSWAPLGLAAAAVVTAAVAAGAALVAAAASAAAIGAAAVAVVVAASEAMGDTLRATG